MLTKRIIPCLDVKDGRVVKGTHFLNLADAGDPVALARAYYEEGADELAFLDISATNERRGTMRDVAEAVADEVFIPFTIGGGIAGVRDIELLLKAGADKVSLNSAAFARPELISEAAKEFGSQAIVISIDAKRRAGGWEAFTGGGTKQTGADAIGWARTAVGLGAGEILLTSIDRDGTNAGFDLELVNAVCESVNVPVIASGGAGTARDFLDAFTKTKASAALAAGIFHYGKIGICELKSYLKENGVGVREC